MGYPTRLADVFDSPALSAKHWVLPYAELAAAGMTDEEIAYRVRTGYLHRKFRGVYAVGRPELSFEGNCRAAWLACGPKSAVSHISGARDHNIRQSTGRIHISVPRGRTGHPGLIIHRPRSLPLDDVVARDGYNVTSLARTVLDMAPGQPVDTVAKWLHEAEVQRVFDAVELWKCLERHQQHRGRRVVEAALAVEVVLTRSDLEELFLAIVRRAGLPEPIGNAWLWSGEKLEEVDFHWPEIGLIVEVDSVKYHSTAWRKRRDREKADRFRVLGWKVWRVPELAITLDPAGVARRLTELGLSNPVLKRIRQPTA